MRNSSLPTMFLGVAILLISFAPARSFAEDIIEKEGMAVGVTAGNMWFLPAKAVSVTNGLLVGALSLILTGNLSLTQQIWHDTLQDPYLITPEVAKKAVGERPELLQAQTPDLPPSQ